MKKLALVSLLSFIFLFVSSCSDDDSENTTNTSGSTNTEALAFLGKVYSCGDFSVNVLQDGEEAKRALLIQEKPEKH